MILPNEDEIILINKKLGYGIVNKGNLEFLFSKIKSMRLADDEKKNLAKAASYLWFGIVSLHPFSDGNKRTATESVKYFLAINNYKINLEGNGVIYISLKIANADISQQALFEFIYERLEGI